MTDDYASDAAAAWEQLKQHGGIEHEGRDVDLVERLRKLLQPDAPTLDAALAGRTAKELLVAFLDAQHDFVAMLRDVLAFYEAAGAARGKQHWRLQVDGTDLGLSHFQQFLDRWEAVPRQFDVPAIDKDGSWAFHRAAGDTPGLGPAVNPWNPHSLTGDEDVDAWITAVRQGSFPPLPRSLQAAGLPAPIRDALALTEVMLTTLRQTWPTREAMMATQRDDPTGVDCADGLDPRTIGLVEHDHLLVHNVDHLLRYHEAAPGVQHLFAQQVAQRYAAYPRRALNMLADQATVDALLALPVWQKRHELYAVWIGTELVRAMGDHDCELHHDAGTIRFGFAKTLLATVHSTSPKLRLYAERRSDLSAPLGEGRVAGVQPDFTLWRGMEPADDCVLVVEVKHYKRSAARPFAEAVIDYARAHARADVVLVNHGPASIASRAGDIPAYAREAQRCLAIGRLTPSSLGARGALAARVTQVVGPRRTSGPMPPPEEQVIVLDVSGSMRDTVKSWELAAWLDTLAGRGQPELVLVDTQIRQRGPLRTLAPTLARGAFYGENAFAAPVAALLAEHEAILFLTDSDGFADLQALPGVALERLTPAYLGSACLEVARIRRTP